MNLVDLRAYVRDYFDLDAEDLPDRLLDRWVSEGWGKIVRYRPNWPGFQSVTQLTVVAGTHTYPVPVKDIEMIDGPERQLVQLDATSAERRFIQGGILVPAGPPVAFSVYNGQVRLWPTPAVGGTYVVRGQRSAINPLDQEPTITIDLPHPDAIEMLLDWVMARCAIREAEDSTAAKYEEHFAQGMQLLAKDELDSPSFTPIVLGSIPATPMGLSSYLPDRLRYADGWE